MLSLDLVIKQALRATPHTSTANYVLVPFCGILDLIFEFLDISRELNFAHSTDALTCFLSATIAFMTVDEPISSEPSSLSLAGILDANGEEEINFPESQEEAAGWDEADGVPVKEGYCVECEGECCKFIPLSDVVLMLLTRRPASSATL